MLLVWPARLTCYYRGDPSSISTILSHHTFILWKLVAGRCGTVLNWIWRKESYLDLLPSIMFSSLEYFQSKMHWWAVSTCNDATRVSSITVEPFEPKSLASILVDCSCDVTEATRSSPQGKGLDKASQSDSGMGGSCGFKQKAALHCCTLDVTETTVVNLATFSLNLEAFQLPTGTFFGAFVQRYI